MNVEWTQPALLDLIGIEEFIEKDSREAAQIVAQRIWDASQSLVDQPSKGRQGYVEGTREWPVYKAPCLLVYRVQPDQVEILHVHYDSSNWKS